MLHRHSEESVSVRNDKKLSCYIKTATAW